MANSAATPIATQVPSRWLTYTNRSYGYTLNIPSNFSIEEPHINDSDQSYVLFNSPGYLAGGSVSVTYEKILSVTDWVNRTEERAKEWNKEMFELVEKKASENPDGTGTAHLIYRAQLFKGLCIERNVEHLIVGHNRSYYFSSYMCEYESDVYGHILDTILQSFSVD